eukprot:TRINITY_DN715_c1_g1_i5.p1 TRINITY_DN715_c1_g1~~TRINITY_DN715_c1_g1_i5.p1  ORF type:complete len:192 (-),score=29.48 TRINITY_DN715_c1_g1_i5:180-755(-)
MVVKLPIPKNPIVKHGIAVALFGSAFFFLEDGMNDVVMYRIFSKKALELARENEQLQDDLGKPFHTQPWYESKIGFSHYGMTAHGSFQLEGSKNSSLVKIMAVRKSGYYNTLFYNLVGPAEWDYQIFDVTVGSYKSPPFYRTSLLPKSQYARKGLDRPITTVKPQDKIPTGQTLHQHIQEAVAINKEKLGQ